MPRLLAGADPAHALELTKGRGQHGKRHVSRNAAMADYIAARIEADPKPRGAVTRALNAAPDHFGTKKQPFDRRQLENIWAEWRGPVTASRRFARELEHTISSVARLSRRIPAGK